ncbi:hypothetical protein [Streptomyces sp. SPB162]|uniref:hypothetical protein n=1 Tax=Streptomyces sp. SPB162 TaxID=2940560 RepID=UPI002406E643|nr:hypothetical protein [Streptomyces sp. SPB162]MDF9813648.1 hypothetical protein [Streptomyces sp. SPB162]
MTVPVSVPPAARRPSPLARVLLTVLLVVAGLITYTLAPLFIMASDACASSSDGGICDPDRQQLIVLLPQIGAPLITTAALIGTLRRDGRAGFGALGLVLLLAIWIINAALV